MKLLTTSAVLVLLGVVKSDSTSLDYRTVSYKDLLSLPSGLQQFDDDGVEHFTELLFDSPHHQVIVGKRFFNQVMFLARVTAAFHHAQVPEMPCTALVSTASPNLKRPNGQPNMTRYLHARPKDKVKLIVGISSKFWFRPAIVCWPAGPMHLVPSVPGGQLRPLTM